MKRAKSSGGFSLWNGFSRLCRRRFAGTFVHFIHDVQPVEVDGPVTEPCDHSRLAPGGTSDPVSLDLPSLDLPRGARATCVVWRAHLLQVAALGLLAFDRLEERLEVSLAEARCTLTLDDLGEQGGAVGKVLGEDLKEIATSVHVDEDA